MQVLAGRWVRVALHRRPLFVCFAEIWKLIGQWQGGPKELPSKVKDEICNALSLLPFARCELQLPFDDVVTCSDASLKGGAFCHSMSLTDMGRYELNKGWEVASHQQDASFVLLSLFDGIGCARHCLDILRFAPALYATSEVHQAAIRVVKFTWPEAVELGDVKKISEADILMLRSMAPRARFVLVAGGSPCQGLSGANAERREFQDERTLLFFELLRVCRLVEKCWPNVSVKRMVENVKSMSVEACKEFSRHLQCKPFALDGGCFSDVNRPRLFWLYPQPQWRWHCQVEDRGHYFLLRPVGWKMMTEWWKPVDASWNNLDEDPRMPTLMRCIPKKKPTFKPAGIDQCGEDDLLRWRNAQWCFPPYHFKEKHLLKQHGVLRTTNADERERERERE
eukprot:12266957-Karenia_brevis.AAC.1